MLRKLGKAAVCFVVAFLFLLAVIGYFTIVIYSDDCDDTPWCPVGKVVKYDFVCGKKFGLQRNIATFLAVSLKMVNVMQHMLWKIRNIVKQQGEIL